MRFCNANINDSLGVSLFWFLLRSQRFQAKNVSLDDVGLTCTPNKDMQLITALNKVARSTYKVEPLFSNL
jgi:hypothetical protein